MGIPGFFRWLASHYPAVVERVTPGVKQSADFLYLDINALFHTANIKKKGRGKSSSRKLTSALMLSKVFRQMDDAIDLFDPKTLVYITMDGVAPRAKMNEQRVRRYLAVNIKPKLPAIVPPIGIPSSSPASEEIAVANEDAMTIEMADTADGDKDREGTEGNTGFFLPGESVAITPGTKFMQAANEAVRFYVFQRLNGRRKHLQIIFNDSSVPGEGEHKLFQFLKTQRMQNGYNPQLRHVVCGGDADFIMYSLMTHEPHLRILRPGMGRDLDILHVAKLRKHLINDMMPKDTPPMSAIDQDNMIEDFVCISMLLGNDFLPKLQGVGTAVNILMKAYRECYKSMGGFITEKGGTINISRYLVFLQQLGNQTLLRGEKLADLSQIYSLRFNIDPETRAKRANDYMRILCWAFQYYTSNCPSWRHFYPHHFPPSILEIIKNVDPTDFDQKFTTGQPLRPFEQLICVLPPTCDSLVPEPFRDLLTDPNSPLKDFFPNKMQVISEVGILPFIDEKILLESMASRYPKLNPEDQKRNTITGKVQLFAGRLAPSYPTLRTVGNGYTKQMVLTASLGIFGTLTQDDRLQRVIETPIKKWGDINYNTVYNVLYQLPKVSGHVPQRSTSPQRLTSLQRSISPQRSRSTSPQKTINLPRNATYQRPQKPQSDKYGQGTYPEKSQFGPYKGKYQDKSQTGKYTERSQSGSYQSTGKYPQSGSYQSTGKYPQSGSYQSTGKYPDRAQTVKYPERPQSGTFQGAQKTQGTHPVPRKFPHLNTSNRIPPRTPIPSHPIKRPRSPVSSSTPRTSQSNKSFSHLSSLTFDDPANFLEDRNSG
ncbi:6006_t:CDS:1 [Ambispora gerdemannii]|uniref:6006_t:CDS:1 n=1 Tax=Ambispora gerdemannii TaxID=144530 RepID=A0A9N8ZZZ8_9GLOM|nr:6006_t:CDS:1 [Ambispora gerdemannii]